MTGSLRSTARNPVAVALMGMLILVFLILGVGGGGRFPDAFKGARADSVVTAGSHAMNVTDYRKVFEREKQALEEQNKQQTTTEFLVKNGVDQGLLSQIALEEGQSEWLTRSGVTPAPALIDAQIKQIPAAFDRVTGKFSEKQFIEILARQGLTPQEVQSEFTDQLALRHAAYAMQAGFKAPRAYAALGAIAALQSRDLSYFVLDQRAVVQPPAPTDAQLQAFLKANAASLTQPEMRVLTLVKFSAAALTPTVTVSAADIQKEFDFRKDSLSSPETRAIVQIPVRNAQEGAAAARRLAQGEDPAAIARSYGAEPVLWTDKPLSAIPDPKLGAAAFAMKAGQVAGPVQGGLGLAAIKVVKVTPATVASLASARAKIVADLTAKAAQNKAYELSQKFDEARQAGAGIADAARKAGVAAITVGPITAEGADADRRPDPAINDKIAKAAFAMKAGEDSDIQDAGPGEYYAMRVEKVIPPALMALEQVRGPLTQAWQRQQLVAVLKTKADSLMDMVRQGKSMDEAAASVSAHVVKVPAMRLVQAQQYKDLGRDFLTRIFGVKPGELFDAGAPNGVFIARVDAIHAADPATTAQFVEAVRARASQDYLHDLTDATRAAAAKSMKVSINLNLARQALGIDPATIAASDKKSASGAK